MRRIAAWREDRTQRLAALHEEVDAVLFRGNGIGILGGDALEDLDGLDVEFKAALGALIGADFAGDDDA